MGKHELLLAEVNKTIEEAPRRSQQYKEALKLKKEIEARIAKEMEVESDASDEAEDDGSASESSEENEDEDEDVPEPPQNTRSRKRKQEAAGSIKTGKSSGTAGKTETKGKSCTCGKAGSSRKSGTVRKSGTSGKIVTSGKSGTAQKSPLTGKSVTSGPFGAAGSTSGFAVRYGITKRAAGASKPEKQMKKKKTATGMYKFGKRLSVLQKKGRRVDNKMPVLRNFMNSQSNSNNRLYYEGYIGNGYTIQMRRFLLNNKCYLSIGKPGIKGVVIDCDFFGNLREAVREIGEGFGEEMQLGSSPTDDAELMEF